MKRMYRIQVDCANCANKMEDAVKKVSGIKDVVINFMTLKMTVDFDDGVDIKEIMENALKVCKKIERDCEIYF